MAVYKFSNVGGFGTYQRYNDFLAGNPAVNLGDFESIATVTVGAGGSSTISFTSIAGTYQHLQIRGIAKSTGAGSQDMRIRLNSNTSAYAVHGLYGNGSTASSNAGTSQAYIVQPYNFVAASSLTSIFGGVIIDILDYANTNKLKTVRTLGGMDSNGAGTVGLYSGFHTTLTAAVTQIDITAAADNFAQHSHFALYGIKG